MRAKDGYAKVSKPICQNLFGLASEMGMSGFSLA
jgi:hypothetical protein